MYITVTFEKYIIKTRPEDVSVVEGDCISHEDLNHSPQG